MSRSPGGVMHLQLEPGLTALAFSNFQPLKLIIHDETPSTLLSSLLTTLHGGQGESLVPPHTR